MIFLYVCFVEINLLLKKKQCRSDNDDSNTKMTQRRSYNEDSNTRMTQCRSDNDDSIIKITQCRSYNDDSNKNNRINSLRQICTIIRAISLPNMMIVILE